MSDLAPILDYAGPRPRGQRVRLPAKSILRWTWDRDGKRLDVVETLAGKSAALAALAFAGFVLVVLGFTTVTIFGKRYDPSAAIPGAVWLLEFGLMLAVINNTWRRTELWATVDGIGLRFRAPLQPRREHWWARDQVGDVLVTRVVLGAYVEPLSELEVRVVDVPAARLFTGHAQGLLAEVATQVRKALRLDEVGVARAALVAPSSTVETGSTAARIP
jgi:hypothetical protein